jgi:hypothetical protein
MGGSITTACRQIGAKSRNQGLGKIAAANMEAR